MMSEFEAAWVREHVWTDAMRATHRSCPGFRLTCACQGGLTHWCRIGEHAKCHRAMPLRDSETSIIDSREHPLHFAKPFRHKTDTSATGPRRVRDALVWLADRVCAWVCPCECHLVGKQLRLDLFAGSC